MQDQLLQLRQLIQAVYPLPDADWHAFAGIWQPFSAKRKEIITAAGEREKYLYFVLEGLQRVYYYDEQDREATLVFTYAPSFGGVLDAMMLRQPSRYTYETLTPSVFLRALYPEVEAIMKSRPVVETMVRMGVTHALSGLLERLAEIQCYSSEDKFRKLLHRSPHILQLVPHKYLANYLGIDPTNFSKLINKIRI
ncbi:Crp/Fnr family transcriptional regulator [Agriterribacter sp.]|uniref:Crp/Fnr family transcriptional regulator n=1 Tax=Agriterribacter sp. TaxID=2821509 RepID=UPI002B91C829|nr:Crp/Fnr family transcriptional regulator [Agriterribacter sp.]HTN07612.1 Crp/Fnr family transcriptional regulator [Agriterribacter sp.]